jgi:C_GCAxxG_C_C family probable redox protein
VLSSFGEEFGLDRECALRVAGAFGGGMARMGDTCGAVTGALMVIGLKYGKAKAGDDGARERTYELAREFVTRFRSRHGSICCRELLGYDLSNPEERAAAHQKGLFDTLCPPWCETQQRSLRKSCNSFVINSEVF